MPVAEQPFEAEFQVTWADLDANHHMRNTRYLDYAAQTRFLYFAVNGFPPAEFTSAGIGPAVLEDKVSYHRELRFLARFRVQLLTGGQNESGSKFAIVNRIFTDADVLAAEVRTLGVWFELRTRKVVTPPAALKAAMDALARTADYAEL
jgi:acyl-CoA thioester hydrolase